MDERNDKKSCNEEKLIEPTDNVYRVATFEKLYRKENNAQRSIFSWTCFHTLNSGSICKFCKEACRNTFPFVQVMRNYKVKQDLPNDVISGITVGIMQIPQGMAYSFLASLPAICGLYVSLFAPLIYFFLGSSKHVSMGNKQTNMNFFLGFSIYPCMLCISYLNLMILHQRKCIEKRN